MPVSVSSGAGQAPPLCFVPESEPTSRPSPILAFRLIFALIIQITAKHAHPYSRHQPHRRHSPPAPPPPPGIDLPPADPTMAPKPPPAVFGFDAVDTKLHELFLSSRNTQSRSSSETSITSMAFKELRSNFQAPLCGVRRSPSAEAAPSAADAPPRPGVARGAATENSTGRPITPSPASTTTVPCRQLRSASASANRSAVSVSSTASVGRNNFRVADRAHQEMQPVTTTATPMRRLQYSEFVRLKAGERFTIVVPPSDRYDNDEAKKGRAAFLASARRLVLHGRGKLSAEEREEFWQEELSSRAITRSSTMSRTSV